MRKIISEKLFKLKSIIKKPFFNKNKSILKKEKRQFNFINFSSPHPIKIEKKQIDLFYEKYFSGHFERIFKEREKTKKVSFISNYRKQHFIYPLTSRTVISFRKYDDFIVRNYLKRYKYLTSFLKKKSPLRSEIVLANVLSVRKINSKRTVILEQVFPSITIFDFYKLEPFLKDKEKYFQEIKRLKSLKKPVGFVQNRFESFFVKQIIEKNISLDKFKKDLDLAYKEFTDNPSFAKNFDSHPNNLVILGYDPKEGIFKFGLIDFFG
jgi:hypothetical protein